jgi:hypothetical protein
MQAIRPFRYPQRSTSSSCIRTDDHLDETQSAVSGEMAARTMLLLGGAGLTTSYCDLGVWEQIPRSADQGCGRLRAVFRQRSFLRSTRQQGLEGIDLPFLESANSGHDAPITEAQDGISRLTGTSSWSHSRA